MVNPTTTAVSRPPPAVQRRRTKHTGPAGTERWSLAPLLAFSLVFLGACAGPGSSAGNASEQAPQEQHPRLQSGWNGLTVRSSLDGSDQPVRLFLPEGHEEPLTLVLHLHTWSADLHQEMFLTELTAGCAQRGWAILAPNFRGPNRNPQACGSVLAVQDIHDALGHLERLVEVDSVYVHGVSGGGHMALLLAAHSPRRWAGVSSWVPITDLKRWHRESRAAGNDYWRDLEAVCGGPPNPATEVEYLARSPMTRLSQAAGVPIDLNAGIRDGHEGSVPVGHTLRAFDRLAKANAQLDARFGPELIATLEGGQTPGLPFEMEGRAHGVLVRRRAGPARVTLFDGAHEGDPTAALVWFEGLRP